MAKIEKRKTVAYRAWVNYAGELELTISACTVTPKTVRFDERHAAFRFRSTMGHSGLVETPIGALQVFVASQDAELRRLRKRQGEIENHLAKAAKMLGELAPK